MGMKTIVSEPPMDSRQLCDKLANEYGINVALHNHARPSIYWDPANVMKFSEGLSPRVGSCADLGHWQRSGIKPVDAVKLLQGRVLASHVKDLNEFGKNEAHDVPWGTGVGGIKETLVEMKKLGLKVTFSIENERGYVGLVGDVSKSIQWFSDVATELAGQ
jgi:sugar phosphate isomerase/epimerase